MFLPFPGPSMAADASTLSHGTQPKLSECHLQPSDKGVQPRQHALKPEANQGGEGTHCGAKVIQPRHTVLFLAAG